MTGIRHGHAVKPLRAPRIQEVGAKALIGFVSFVLIPAFSQVQHVVDVCSEFRSRHAAH